MPASMTGYGGAKIGGISLEIKTVNHRYFDFSARIPRECLWAEDKLRSLIGASIKRGKAECFLRIAPVQIAAPRVKADKKLAAEYLQAIKSLVDDNLQEACADERDNVGARNQIYGICAESFMRMPGVISLEPPDADADALWAEIEPVARQALDELLTMRQREGKSLTEDIESHLTVLETALTDVADFAPQAVKAYRERLETRIRELLENYTVDDDRILTETAIFAEKTAVDEEISRLYGHIAHMREHLKSTEAVGRKLDFLTQEMNREANTIGSKCLDSAITVRVLEMKSEIEKIREQVQNIE